MLIFGWNVVLVIRLFLLGKFKQILLYGLHCSCNYIFIVLSITSLNLNTQEKEDKLVDLLKKGEQRAYAELYDMYGENLLMVIRRTVAQEEDAENLLQDCFVKIWRNIDQFDPTLGRLYTWIVSIARHIAIDFARSAYFSRRQMIQSEERLVTDIRYSVESENLDWLGFDKVLGSLEGSLRQLIDLQYFLGFTQQEVADKLGLPLGTVKSRTRTALRRLRQKIENE
ncbi:MAG: RNA polymerase sigma factor [Saprospiraceae bacterium]